MCVCVCWQAAVDKIWKTLAAPYGFETFQDMRAAWHKERAAAPSSE